MKALFEPPANSVLPIPLLIILGRSFHNAAQWRFVFDSFLKSVMSCCACFERLKGVGIVTNRENENMLQKTSESHGGTSFHLTATIADRVVFLEVFVGGSRTILNENGIMGSRTEQETRSFSQFSEKLIYRKVLPSARQPIWEMRKFIE